MRLFLRRSKYLKRFLMAAFSVCVLSAGILCYVNFKNKSYAAEVDPSLWTLTAFFTDSAVDDGNTQLTTDSWNIGSDTSSTESRLFTFQVNYKAEVIDRDYDVGELEIKLEMPFGSYDSSTGANKYYTQTWSDDLTGSYTVSALNKDSDAFPDGRNWNYSCEDSTDDSKPMVCTFTNANAFTAGTSIDGAFQVVYKMSSGDKHAPFFKTDYSVDYHYTGKATLNDMVDSNSLSFNFHRDYKGNWRRDNYTIHVYPRKISSFDGLGADAADYIWVHYFYYGSKKVPRYAVDREYDADWQLPATDSRVYDDRGQTSIPLSDWYWYDALSPDVKVLDKDKNEISRTGDNYIVSRLGTNSRLECKDGSYDSGSCSEIYVGYPKNKYNEALGTNIVTDTVYSRGTYIWNFGNPLEEEALDDDTAEVDLSEFDLEYSGNVVGINKSLRSTDYRTGEYAHVPLNTSWESAVAKIYGQQFKTEEGASLLFNVSSSVLNVEGTYMLAVGDDVLYSENLSTGAKTRIDENGYHFASIRVPEIIYDSSTSWFECDDISANVYYRLRGESEYHLLEGAFDKACGQESNKRVLWDFDSDEELKGKVVGWRVEVPNLDRPIYEYQLATDVKIHSSSLPNAGKIYNFSYVEMRDANSHIINNVDINSYAEGVSRSQVASYDMSTYGHYRQRAFADYEYESYTIGEVVRVGTVEISDTSFSDPSFDSDSDSFKGKMKAFVGSFDMSTDGSKDKSLTLGAHSADDFIRSIKGVIFLPAGFTVSNTEEELRNALEYIGFGDDYGLDGEDLFTSNYNGTLYVRQHATVKIDHGIEYEGALVDRISVFIDFSDKPFSRLNVNNYSWTDSQVRFVFNYSAPYELYQADPMARYTFNMYGFSDRSCLNETEERKERFRYSYLRFCSYEDVEDYDENGDSTEFRRNSNETVSLVGAQSAEQSMKEFVKTDQTPDYTMQDSWVTLGADYSYRLTAHTGMNRATNVVIYDSLETAYEDNPYWQGVFDGVDTSFAESKTDFNGNQIKVKVYYSTNANAGSLKTNGTLNSDWKAYQEGTTNKSQVKAVAFEYLTTDNTPAVLASNDYVYTIIKMKSPNNDNREARAYNMFRSEWNAIDSQSGEALAGVVGISSNVTKVQIDHPITVRVVKQWEDFDNKYSTRPSTVTPTVKRGNEVVDSSKSINTTQNGASVDYTGLHEYYRDDYSTVVALSAQDAEHYTTQFVSKVVEGDLITFTYKSSLAEDKITVRKIWIDNNNSEGLRPSSVDFDLKRNSTVVDEHTLDTSGDGSQFEFDFEDFPAYLFDEFSVPMIDAIPNYTTELEVSADRHTYTFTSTLSAPLTVKVKQIWIDNNDAYGYRPDSFEYTLNKPVGSENKTLNFGDDGSVTEFSGDFTNLNLIDRPSYTIDSMPNIEIPNYTTTKTFDYETMTYTYTSTLNVPLEIHIKQIWVDENDERGLRADNHEYVLKKTGGEDAPHAVDFGDNGAVTEFTTDYTGLDLLDKEKFSVEDVEFEHYSTSGPIVTENETGTSITYTFTSTLIDNLDIYIKQVWDDEDNWHGLRPEETSYTLVKGNSDVEEKVLNIADGDSGSVFVNLRMPDKDQYDVPLDKAVISDDYTTTVEFDPDTMTYTFTSVLKTEPIKVVHIWDDEENVLGVRPEEISFDLVHSVEAECIEEPIDDDTDLDGDDDVVPSDEGDDQPSQDDGDTEGEDEPEVCYDKTVIKSHTMDVLEEEDTHVFERVPSSMIDEFSVEMVPIEHYKTTVEFDPDTMTYTFTSVLRSIDIHVVNIWEDNNNALGKRPDSLTFDLTNKEEVERTHSITTSEYLERFDFEKLFEYMKEDYDVVLEQYPADYETKVDFDPSTMTFTFTHTIIAPTDTSDSISMKVAGFVGATILSLGALLFGLRRRQ